MRSATGLCVVIERKKCSIWTFSYINVHSNIFKLVEELSLDDNSIDTGNIFIDFLNQIYSDDSNIVEGLAKGVVYNNIHIVAKNIFMLYKEGCNRDNITYRALRFFLNL